MIYSKTCTRLVKRLRTLKILPFQFCCYLFAILVIKVGYYQYYFVNRKENIYYFTFKDNLLDIKRSSRPEVFCKKGVLRNFAKFRGKHMCHAILLKKRFWHRCFSVNFAKFLRTPFLQSASGRLLLTAWCSGFLG